MIRILRDEIYSLEKGPGALRSFGLLVGGVLLVAAAVLYWLGGWSATTAVYVLAGFGGVLVLLGTAVPTLLKPIYVVWMALALLLGFIMTRLLLAVVFFLIVTPIAIAMRLLGRDPLNRRIEREAASYWQEKSYDHESPARLEKYY